MNLHSTQGWSGCRFMLLTGFSALEMHVFGVKPILFGRFSFYACWKMPAWQRPRCETRLFGWLLFGRPSSKHHCNPFRAIACSTSVLRHTRSLHGSSRRAREQSYGLKPTHQCVGTGRSPFHSAAHPGNHVHNSLVRTSPCCLLCKSFKALDSCPVLSSASINMLGTLQTAPACRTAKNVCASSSSAEQQPAQCCYTCRALRCCRRGCSIDHGCTYDCYGRRDQRTGGASAISKQHRARGPSSSA
jgi:hypothetical protein